MTPLRTFLACVVCVLMLPFIALDWFLHSQDLECAYKSPDCLDCSQCSFYEPRSAYQVMLGGE